MIRTVDIPRNDSAPLVARRALERLSTDLDPEIREDARLLVSELVANSVRHGAGERVRVVLGPLDRDGLRCEVVDDGSGFLPTARAADRSDGGGWGLRLVERLSHDWGVREGSTHVWFELRAR